MLLKKALFEKNRPEQEQTVFTIFTYDTHNDLKPDTSEGKTPCFILNYSMASEGCSYISGW